jgi:hypothetical protein
VECEDGIWEQVPILLISGPIAPMGWEGGDWRGGAAEWAEQNQWHLWGDSRNRCHGGQIIIDLSNTKLLREGIGFGVKLISKDENKINFDLDLCQGHPCEKRSSSYPT